MVSVRRWLVVGVFLATGCRWGFELQSTTDGSDGSDASVQPSELCTATWCWDDPPPPRTRTLRAISGSGPDDIWAVGDGGIIRRYNGTEWELVPSPTSDALFAIDVASPSDVTVAAGAGALWHYDGSQWSLSMTASGSSVAALWRDKATNRLWAAGENGTMTADNVALTSQPARVAATALHGTSATNIWHGGLFNTASRWTGTWSTRLLSDFPRGVWALTTGDAFFAGSGLWRCSTASCVDQNVSTSPLYGMWGTGDADVWAVGRDGSFQHWNGTTWLTATPPDAMTYLAIWGSAATDIWAVGLDGAIAHYDGATWTSTGNTTPLTTRGNGLWVGDDNDRWFIDDITLVHDDGTAIATAQLPSGATPWDEIEGASTDLYTLDSAGGGLLHYDGTSWASEPGLSLAMPQGLAHSTTEVLASNLTGQVMRKPTGGSWSMSFNQGGTEWHAICLSASGTALVVGRFGSAVQRIGTAGAWTLNTPPTGRFLLSCDFADENAWVAGGDAVLTWVAGTWTLLSNVGSGQSFYDVLAVSQTEVYIAGGKIYRFDGTSWAEQAMPSGSFFRKVVAGTNGRVYAIGDETGVLRRR